MHFSIMDENVSLTMNIFLIIANIINLIYNIPQIIKTYKTKSTVDFSEWFLFLRIFGNIIWVAYAIEVDSFLMLINNLVTVFSSVFIGYYKTIELYNNYKEKYNQLENEPIDASTLETIFEPRDKPKIEEDSPKDSNN
jgi:uncharacterized protein with PQ loop repeat